MMFLMVQIFFQNCFCSCIFSLITFQTVLVQLSMYKMACMKLKICELFHFKLQLDSTKTKVHRLINPFHIHPLLWYSKNVRFKRSLVTGFCFSAGFLFLEFPTYCNKVLCKQLLRTYTDRLTKWRLCCCYRNIIILSFIHTLTIFTYTYYSGD